MSRTEPHTTAAKPAPPRAGECRTRLAGPAGAVTGVSVLLLAAAAVGGVAMWIGGGRPGLARAVAFAAAASLPGFLAAWVLTRRAAADPGQALAASLAAITLRTLPPLAALAWLSGPRQQAAAARAAEGPPPVDAAGILVALYLALLVTDVLLHMMSGRAGHGRGH